MDVASQIIPTSVHIKSLIDPNSLSVLEQNYEYDLLNPQKLLDKYVGREVKLNTKNIYTGKEELVTATLLSNNGGPIFRIGDEITFGHPGRIIFPGVPDNLISQPTLVWTLDNSLATAQTVETSYLTNGITWQSDYVVTLNDKDAHADLAGWVTIDNKSGAGGTIGAAEVARAKPDGYTLLLGTSSSHAINPTAMDNPPYDPVKDFAPIAVIGIVPMSIAVHPNVAKSLQELIKRVRANPGKYSYGSTGVGGINHLAGELFIKQTGGLDIVHVPYRSSGQSIQELVAGQIPIVFATFSSAVAYHHSGRLRILAVFSEKRSDAEPDIPTAIELGVPDMLAYTFNILLAPAGTPKEVIAQLHQATMKVMSDAAFQKDLNLLTVEPVTDSNPEKATQFIKNELAKWAPIIKASGMKAK